MAALEVGTVAPDFVAKTQDEAMTIKLSSLRGKRVVLYFYPKDNTPGCTTEACDFRDHLAVIEEKNAVILGVSPDSSKSHAGFASKFDLPFTLVADPDREIANLYGVYREKTSYGKTAMGIVRSTFVIDEEGKIARIYDKVKVDGHVHAVAEFLGEMGAPKKKAAT